MLYRLFRNMDFSEIFIKMLVGLFKRFTDHS